MGPTHAHNHTTCIPLAPTHYWCHTLQTMPDHGASQGSSCLAASLPEGRAAPRSFTRTAGMGSCRDPGTHWDHTASKMGLPYTLASFRKDHMVPIFHMLSGRFSMWSSKACRSCTSQMTACQAMLTSSLSASGQYYVFKHLLCCNSYMVRSPFCCNGCAAHNRPRYRA